MKTKILITTYLFTSLAMATVVTVKPEDIACKVDLDCANLTVGCCDDLAHVGVNSIYFPRLNAQQHQLCHTDLKARFKVKAKDRTGCKRPATFTKPMKPVCQNNACALIPFHDLKK